MSQLSKLKRQRKVSNTTFISLSTYIMRALIVFAVLISNTIAVNVPKTVRLNSGKECPIIGLGTGRSPQDDVVKQMVYDAIDAGYRHIDTAALYGNEKAIGQAVNEVIRQGKVKREEVFITTKIFFKDYPDQKRRQQTVQNVQLALQKLNTKYIDLMLIHWPSNDSVNSEMWTGLEDSLYQGLVKSIGVSNFNIEQLESLLKTAKIVPAMNQVESNPKKNQRELKDFCAKYGIKLTAYSPLGKGSLISEPTIVEIGKKHNKSAAQVMIRWQIQRGVVAIPKSSKKERIKENIDVFDFSLTDEEMSILENMSVNSSATNRISIHLIFMFTLISIGKYFR